MVLAVVLVCHFLMSMAVFSIPYMTRREMLFGVVLPADFRQRREGRRAIRAFQMTVVLSGVAGGLIIILLNSRWTGAPVLGSGFMMVSSFTAFVLQNRKLKVFAVQPPPVRELELSAEPERLPRYVWLGVVPPLILAGVAFYLHAHWDSIPKNFPIHWRIDGQADRWVARTPRGVYGSLAFGAAMALWLFGFSLAVWYGSRRSEPLRRPVLGVFIALEWAVVVMMSGGAMAPLIRLPIVSLSAISVAVILACIVYLIKANRNARAALDPTPNGCWKGGLLYYNPDDPVLFVGRRDGAGFTINMANPWSWVAIASPLLIAFSRFLIR